MLTHRDQPCDDLNGGIYAFGRGELFELIETVWETLWPNEKPSATEVELVEMPTEQWEEHKQRGTAQSSTK